MKTKYILISLLVLISQFSAEAQTFEVDGICYTIYSSSSSSTVVDGVETNTFEGKVFVSKRTENYSGSIVIPETVNYEDKTYTVDRIGSAAFSRCNALLSVSLPNTLLTIDESAFYGCDGLSSITIPKSVMYVGKQSFANCGALSTIKVDSDNPTYSSPNNCNAIIKKDTLVIGCKSTVIPGTVKVIQDYAFYFCDGLKNLSIPNSVKVIGSRAFNGCSQMSISSFSNGIEEIGSYAFNGCSSMTSISLPNTLLTIDESAFYDCDGLSSITIPKSVMYVGKQSFANCDALSTIKVDSDNPTYSSPNNCNAIIKKDTLVIGCKSTVIPETVKAIREYAFYFCQGLADVSIPNTISTIEQRSFSGCSNLKEVLCNISEPFVIEDNVFSNISKDAILYVPKGKTSEYVQMGWDKYFSSIEEIESNPIITSDGLYIEINQRKGYAKLLSIDENIRHLIIPSTISYLGEDYLLKEIASRAFEESSILSLKIPESVTSISDNCIMNCYDLASIEWDLQDRPTSGFLNNIVNPNLLFYVKSSQAAPFDIRNIIVNGTADEIILDDNEYGNFYCPMSFKAKKISYTHNYCLKTEKGTSQGWESIALPFDVQTYTTAKGEAKPYKVANIGERLFWLRELTASGMVESEGIKAYVPYIISMPNWEGYQDFYNIEGDVIFSSQNVTVERTDEKAVDYAPRHFWPCFQNIKKVSNCFVLNKQHLIPSDTYDGEEYLPGSAFLGNLREINPFEAYMIYDIASARAITISELCGETTSVNNILSIFNTYAHEGVLYINSNKESVANIYNITGQLCRTVKIAKGHNEVTGLGPGIYLIDGKKVIIK